jgi:hypothetical protein
MRIMHTQATSDPDDLDARARARIKQWLSTTRTTQVSLSRHINRTQAWTSRYLSGEFNADLATLDRMARCFGHTVAALFDVPTDPDEAILLAGYRSLSLKARAAMVALMRDLSGYPPAGRGRRRR